MESNDGNNNKSIESEEDKNESSSASSSTSDSSSSGDVSSPTRLNTSPDSASSGADPDSDAVSPIKSEAYESDWSIVDLSTSNNSKPPALPSAYPPLQSSYAPANAVETTARKRSTPQIEGKNKKRRRSIFSDSDKDSGESIDFDWESNLEMSQGQTRQDALSPGDSGLD